MLEKGLSVQHWGVVAGVMVYLVTLLAVGLLLVFGGSVKRMREQGAVFREAGPEALKQQLQERPMLYDELLKAAATLPARPHLGPDGVLRGKLVDVRPLLPSADAKALVAASDGSPTFGHAYEPKASIWRYMQEGPFATPAELTLSELFRSQPDALRMTVVARNHGRPIGAVSLLGNDPRNLRVEIGDFWLNPAFQETAAGDETCLLLLNHLFALGYRRVEWRADSADARSRRFAERVGFGLEGVLRKHSVVRGGNRDTAMYAILNSDWRDGPAKAALERRVHGRAAAQPSAATTAAVTAEVANGSSTISSSAGLDTLAAASLVTAAVKGNTGDGEATPAPSKKRRA